MHTVSVQSLLLLLCCAASTACGDIPGSKGDDTASGSGDSGDSGTAGDSGDSSDSSGSDDTGGSGDTSVTTPSSIHGTITFELYTTDSAGDIVSLNWDDYYGADFEATYGTTFPFGPVFVTGLTQDTDGVATYWSQEVITSPDAAGDDYSLEFAFDTDTDIYVYAALDYYKLGIIAPYDPSSVYPSTVTVSPGVETDDVNITILVPYYDFSGTGGGSGDGDGLPGGLGGGSGGGDGSTYINITGNAAINLSYAAGDAVALVYDTTGYGPYGGGWFTPVATDDGATGSYTARAPVSMGDAELLGAWDSNDNGIIDPADQWGGYSTDGDTPTTITVGTEDLSGYDLTIPLGTPPVSVVPFVIDGGNVLLDDLTLAKVTSASKLYITAQKYRPAGSFDPVDDDKTYGSMVYDSADITDTNAYSMLLPADTVVYLWACLDVDGNGTVDEAGEPCGQPVTDGKIATGTSSDTTLDFWIHTFP